MKEKKNVRTMDIILAVIAVFLLLFIAVLLWLYYQTGAIPDTLCTCVFAACGGECGVMGWIKTTKERRRERSFELEDRAHEEQRQKEMEEKLNE
ncbi:MAG: hypothetical protein K1W25_15455 [Lachnospiraceae bacterium]